MNRLHVVALCVALGFGIGAAQAQTLYKLIDRNGKITYAEKPPKDYDGKVIRMDIDPNANTATLPKPKPPDTSGREGSDRPGAEERSQKKSSGDRVKDARDKLAAARKAHQDAVDNPGVGDITRVGTVSGFTRPVFSETYTARLAALEAAVKSAEEELKRAEGG